MARLKVIQTHQRKAFDIIDAPKYEERHEASSVRVRYKDFVEEGCIKTYANDPRPFGPTIRHQIDISENFIDKLHLCVGQEYRCVFHPLDNGIHEYELIDI